MPLPPPFGLVFPVRSLRHPPPPTRRRPSRSPFSLSSSLTPMLPDALLDLLDLNARYALLSALPHAWKCGVLYFDPGAVLQTLNEVGAYFRHPTLFVGPELREDLQWLLVLKDHLDCGHCTKLMGRCALVPCYFASAALPPPPADGGSDARQVCLS